MLRRYPEADRAKGLAYVVKQFRGRGKVGGVVRVTVDCGFSLSALITRPACDELRLTENSVVTAVVKATAIHLIPREPPSVAAPKA